MWSTWEEKGKVLQGYCHAFFCGWKVLLWLCWRAACRVSNIKFSPSRHTHISIHIILSKIVFRFFIDLFFLELKMQCVSILYIFLIYFKTLKLVIIRVLWRHSKKTALNNPVKNPNSQKSPFKISPHLSSFLHLLFNDSILQLHSFYFYLLSSPTFIIALWIRTVR